MAFPSPALTNPDHLDPPIAERVPQMCTYHGHSYVDCYRWLQEDDPTANPKVAAYLESENVYADAALQATRDLRNQIYNEFLASYGATAQSSSSSTTTRAASPSMLDEAVNTVPIHRPPYMYYWKIVPGKVQRMFYRRRHTPIDGSVGREELLIDFNDPMHACITFHTAEVSPDHQWVAYVVDTANNGKLSLYFYHIASRQVSPRDVVHNVTPSICWANDSQMLLYCTPTLPNRPGQVYRHALNTSIHHDALVLENQRVDLTLMVRPSASRQFIFLDLVEPYRNETYFVPADNVTKVKPTVIQPFAHRLRYFVEHQGPNWVILANRTLHEPRINGQIFFCPVSTSVYTREHWIPLLPYNPYALVQNIYPFANHLVLFERSHGKPQLRVLSSISPSPESPAATLTLLPSYTPNYTGTVTRTSANYCLGITEGAYTLSVTSVGQSYHSNCFRYTLSSFLIPPKTYEYDLDNQRRRLIHQVELVSSDGFDPHSYSQEKLYADLPTVRDAFHLRPPRYLKIPVSLVYRTELLRQDGTNPALILVHGCHGDSYDPKFKLQWKSLLDRGFVVAIAHVRGGSENSRTWYEVYGKLLQKKSGIYDLLAVVNLLTKRQYTSFHKTAVMAPQEGAAGTLVAAAMNLKPYMFRVAVLQSPAVDLLNALMASSATLSHDVRDEFGDPATDTTIFKYIHSYSPYHHIAPHIRMPHVLVYADTKASKGWYWEAAKWVAQARAVRLHNPEFHETDDERSLVLVTQLNPIPGQASKYAALQQLATSFAFIIHKLESSQPEPRNGSTLFVKPKKEVPNGSREILFDPPRPSTSSR
ncbi:hypothetical protein H4R35_003738 [Dimargaris xerosporica]|nr:hypothetical protein H4R35_003738 [Dimargaris xerosporica]